MKNLNKVWVIISLIVLISIFYVFYKINSGFNNGNGNMNIVGFSIKDTNYQQINDPLQFYQRMRFVNKNIFYKIDNNCSSFQMGRMKEAFEIISNKTGAINFIDTGNTDKNEDILVTCDNSYNLSDEYIKIGEGESYSIINTGYFNIIKTGRITLTNDTLLCSEPNTELHELLHVLGFKHSLDNQSIMYNISDCSQQLDKEIIDNIKNLYTINNLPDLYFEEFNTTNNYDYLSFNAKILNKGLKEAKKTSLIIYSGNNKVNSFDLGDINYGEGKIVNVEDLNIKGYNKLNFVITDSEDLNQSDNSETVNIV